MPYTREQVEWLRTLINAHAEAIVKLRIEGVEDEDPDATWEMHRECGRLADALAQDLDMADRQLDLPTDDEVRDMARAAGLDDIPF